MTVIEFGVASGAGLLNMVELASLISSETGINFKLFGFDTGRGLPQIDGYKDHPELWNPGDFATEDPGALLQKLDGRADVIWGNISDTIDGFVARLSAPSGLSPSMLIFTRQPNQRCAVSATNRTNIFRQSACTSMT